MAARLRSGASPVGGLNVPPERLDKLIMHGGLLDKLRSGTALALMAGALAVTAPASAADSSPPVINAAGGTWSTDGLRIAYDTGQLRVHRADVDLLPYDAVTTTGVRVTGPSSGIFLRVGDRLVGKAMAGMGAPAEAITAREDWTSVRQSGGSTTGAGTVTSTLDWTQPGTLREYSVDVALQYDGVGSEVHETFTVQVPDGNADVVKLYQVMRSSLTYGFGQQSPGRIGAIGYDGSVVGIKGGAATRQSGTFVGTFPRLSGEYLDGGRDLPPTLDGSDFSPGAYKELGVSWDLGELQGGGRGSVPRGDAQTVEQDLQFGPDPALVAERLETITLAIGSRIPLSARTATVQVSTRSGREPAMTVSDGTCGLKGHVVTLRRVGPCSITAALGNDAGHSSGYGVIGFEVYADSAPTGNLIPVPKNPPRSGPLQRTVAWHRSRGGLGAEPVETRVWEPIPRGGAATVTDGFGFGSSGLNAGGLTQVRFLTPMLFSAHAVECEGHSDYAEPLVHQQRLSLARAEAVCAALSRHGLTAMTTSRGYGGTWPAVVGHDTAMRSVVGGNQALRPDNRRVVVVVTR
jgi:outer membrane protein OmpA-like peptidoglycan-associated protein